MKKWKVTAIIVVVILLIVLLLASYEPAPPPHEHTDAELAKGCRVPVSKLQEARKDLESGLPSSIVFGSVGRQDAGINLEDGPHPSIVVGRCSLTKIAAGKLQLDLIDQGKVAQ